MLSRFEQPKQSKLIFFSCRFTVNEKNGETLSFNGCFFIQCFRKFSDLASLSRVRHYSKAPLAVIHS